MKMRTICGAILVASAVALSAHGAVEKAQVNFTRQRIFPGFDGKLCKIQPSIATDGKGTALLGFQKLPTVKTPLSRLPYFTRAESSIL